MLITVPQIQTAPQIPPQPLAGYLRPLQLSDIDGLARLFLYVYRDKTGPPSSRLCTYFRRLFFSDPWANLDVSPSMGYFSMTGDLQGFFGTYPRRFVCGGERIPAVLLGQLMVHPQVRRQGIARMLTSAIIAGPQQLTYTTTASVIPSNRMLRQLSFWNPAHAGLRWYVNLDPLRSLSGLPGAGRISQAVGRVRRWVAACRGPALGRPVDGPAELCELREQVTRTATLRPYLDEEHAQWVWDLLSDTTARGNLASWLFEDAFGSPLGYALYFVSRDRHAKVIELAAMPGLTGEVVRRFFAHAVCTGLVGIRGQCTGPSMTAALVNHGARLSHSLSGTVFHTNHSAVKQALTNGDTFLSELDAESWLHFGDA